uniref:Predicted protein n=1 Tax=Hordeum vulgare subsp. vulgare TaxID=112509 RepID=F2D6V1_HORVV|nr:predicted protein [Hordeum vulgare subsp. vulgare]
MTGSVEVPSVGAASTSPPSASHLLELLLWGRAQSSQPWPSTCLRCCFLCTSVASCTLNHQAPRLPSASTIPWTSSASTTTSVRLHGFVKYPTGKTDDPKNYVTVSDYRHSRSTNVRLCCHGSVKIVE